MTVRPAIEAFGVGYTFERWGHRVRALNNVTVTINEGEWALVVGPNGSGKSTLLKLLAGHLPVQEGSIHICGRKVGTPHGKKLSDLAFLVHQDPRAGTAPALTVGEHLVMADGSSNDCRTARRRHQQGYLELFQLNADIDQPVETLSGGQRQLLCLLLAKLRPAPVILLDEPFAALDEERAALCESALVMLRDAGKTLVMITHDLAFARTRGDRVIELNKGCVLRTASRASDGPDIAKAGTARSAPLKG